MSPQGLLLLAVGAAPALVLLWLSRRTRPLALALIPFAPLPALALATWGAEAHVAIPILFTGLHFGMDPVGRAFLFFTAALWVAGGLYARSYLGGDPRREGFFGFYLLTLTGQLTLVVAQDILTFYLGFAVMTFAGYGLVVHAATVVARRAGRVYIAMAVGGEAMLLSAVLLLAAAGEGWTLADLPGAYTATPSPTLVAWLVVAGFAVKAGLVPLHVWLPLAHPVAPTPASALLSGAMIKAGLLGWIRFLPLGAAAVPAPGTMLVAIGLAAAFYGVLTGLAQDEPKTVLAYSSVSQMGYMAVGIGIALLVPAEAAAAVLATGHYAGHHAAAKAALFLAVGLAPGLLAGRGRLGPPVRALFYLGLMVPALALAGAPFTSGSAAKSALKHAGDALPATWATALPVALSLAAAGTTLLLARFLAVLRADARRGAPPAGHGPTAAMVVSWAGLVTLSLLAPGWLPRIFPPPPELSEPFPVLGLFDSLWPVGAGLVLALGTWRFRRHVPVRPDLVPAGDLLEWGLAGWRRLTPVLRGRPFTFPPATDLRRLRAGRWVNTFGVAVARAEAGLTTTVGVGVLLLMLLGLLAAAWALGA
jgi:formate hydrogenlyase subunit 3/multisubunit Na+/H+ antiporter MnhD subunit